MPGGAIFSRCQFATTIIPSLIGVLLCMLAVTDAASSFTKWPLQYCHHDHGEYAIPPLTGETSDLELLQVQTVIRHGARGPISFCWEGYDVSWDCSVSQLQSPVGGKVDSRDPLASRLFDKVYDAGSDASKCMSGNLLAEGYEEEAANGRILNKAFIGPSRIHLFKSTDLTPEELSEQVYLRSDDSPRTVMSGQVLFNSFFPPPPEGSSPPPVQVVPWHTQDMSQDNININPKLCPVLSDLLTAASASKKMQDVFRRQKKAMEEIVSGPGYGEPTFADFTDCLLATVCAKHKTPFSVHDAQRVGKLLEEMYDTKYTVNGGGVAKLGMAPLWREIRGRVRAAVAGEPVHKFVLYSGHDTTIMPMLAAVGGSAYDGAFAPYASMLNLEVYARDNGGHMFRATYNGKELLFPGCSHPLCPVEDLESALSFIEDFTPHNCRSTATTLGAAEGVIPPPPPTPHPLRPWGCG